MRSAREIAFRLRQETANLVLLAAEPEPGEGWEPGRSALLPGGRGVAGRLRGTAYAEEVIGLAGEARAGRFRLLGYPPVEAGSEVRWRRDYVHGIETGTEYFRLIRYLDFARAGDHKVIWEMNRHQHLVLLAQAYLLTGREEFTQAIERDVSGWIEQNPYQRGINWASALEVAFRTLSWAWTFHLAAEAFRAEFRRRWLSALYRHALHLENNLSVYFSPNTHLLGEAVALHGVGALFPEMPGAERWRRKGARVALEQMESQVRADGSHFEQSAYYHLYATDFFLLHLVLNPAAPEWYRKRLKGMAEYLDAISDEQGRLPLLGDDDGGRVFHPYGERRRFAAATLATCSLVFERPEWLRDRGDAAEQAAWWLGATEAAQGRREKKSRLFADAGIAALESGPAHLVVDAGAMGFGTAGHSHAGALGIVASVGGRELLIDPGTYTYISDERERARYRGTGAHNTMWIDRQDQATPAGPFRWADKPSTKIEHWASGPEADILDARCRYRGFTHRRSLVFRKPDVLLVVDRVDGPEGEHLLEQRWLCPKHVPGGFLACWPEGATAEPAERSRVFGSSEAAMRFVSRRRTALPAEAAAAVGLGREAELSVERREGGELLLRCGDAAARFPASGLPELAGA
jgi:hypothetical protein